MDVQDLTSKNTQNSRFWTTKHLKRAAVQDAGEFGRFDARRRMCKGVMVSILVNARLPIVPVFVEDPFELITK